jgi:hypothetical protein
LKIKGGKPKSRQIYAITPKTRQNLSVKIIILSSIFYTFAPQTPKVCGGVALCQSRRKDNDIVLNDQIYSRFLQKFKNVRSKWLR